MRLVVLGIDPGFASIGVARMEFFEPTEEDNRSGPNVLCAKVIHTEKSAKKRAVRASDDNFRRARELYDLLFHEAHDCSALCVESMSFPPNSAVASKMAMCWGVLAGLASSLRLAVMQASPQEIKQAVCGAKNASKKDIQKALAERYIVTWPTRKTDVEHAADALAAIVACLDTEMMRALMPRGTILRRKV